MTITPETDYSDIITLRTMRRPELAIYLTDSSDPAL